MQKKGRLRSGSLKGLFKKFWKQILVFEELPVISRAEGLLSVFGDQQQAIVDASPDQADYHLFQPYHNFGDLLTPAVYTVVVFPEECDQVINDSFGH